MKTLLGFESSDWGLFLVKNFLMEFFLPGTYFTSFTWRRMDFCVLCSESLDLPHRTFLGWSILVSFAPRYQY